MGIFNWLFGGKKYSKEFIKENTPRQKDKLDGKVKDYNLNKSSKINILNNGGVRDEAKINSIIKNITKLKTADDAFGVYQSVLEHLSVNTNKDNAIAWLKLNEIINFLSITVEKKILHTTLFTNEDMSVSFRITTLYHLRGVTQFNLHQPSAFNDFSKVLEIDSEAEDSLYMRAQSSFWHNQDWESALVDIKKYLKFKPDDNSGNQLLNVLNKVKKGSKEIVKLFKSGQAKLSEGTTLLKKEEYKKADKYLRDAIENFNQITSLYNLGKKYNWNSDIEKIPTMNKKVEPYLYLKSHSISLMDVNFKIIQCYLSLGANAFDSTEKSVENLMNYCKEIYFMSYGNYQPPNGELGSDLYINATSKLNK